MKRIAIIIVSLMLGLMTACTAGANDSPATGNQSTTAVPTSIAATTPVPTATPTPSPTPTPVPTPAWMTGCDELEGREELYEVIGFNTPEGDDTTLIAFEDGFVDVAFTGYWSFDDDGYYETFYSGVSISYTDKNTKQQADTYLENSDDIRYGYCRKYDEDSFCFYDEVNNSYLIYGTDLKLKKTVNVDNKVYEPGIPAEGTGEFYNICSEYLLYKVNADGTVAEIADLYEKLMNYAPSENNKKIRKYMELIDVLDGGRYVSVCFEEMDEDVDEYRYKTAYFDTYTGEVAGIIDYYCETNLSDDGKTCVLVGKRLRNEIIVADVKTKTQLCEVDIDCAEECSNYDIDWENNLIITNARYENGDNYPLFEYRVYSLEDGNAKKATVLSYESYRDFVPFVAFDEDGVIFTIGTYTDGITVLNLWNYLETEENDTSKYFEKYGVISETTDTYRKELEQQYGINIYLSGEAMVSEFDFECNVISADRTIYEALEEVDRALAIYPEGFLDQMKSNGIKTLAFYLVGGINQKYDYTISNASAFATSHGYEKQLVIDITMSNLYETIVHEISHWIDRFIESIETRKGKSSFDEEFNKLNPEDFEYMYSYVSYDYIQKYIVDGMVTKDNRDNFYFIDDYSQTFPTEDRARCFEYLMTEEYYDYYKCPAIRAKMRYICDQIRENFDTEGWPDETEWEKKLKKWEN